MKGNEIRSRFFEYFSEKGHTVVDSSSLVPHNDQTLLFTNAGMVQFKKVFMGEEKPDFVRAATAQRCVRAGGKHNDLENVGYTARHHTFFEMLGNFSFGDYFKKEAITYGWEFLTKELGINSDRLWVSVFEDDQEAYDLWQQVDGLSAGRIVRLGEKDNFWSMGDTGPCGSCSEIYIDQGVQHGCGQPDCTLGCDCDRFLELWNLVFMQFNRDESGTMTPLPKPSIDTGMGLERVAAVLQGKQNNFDCDLFSGIINKIAILAGKTYKESERDTVAMRVIADHSRATVFLVADGVLPANEGRGYVLRRIMRRAIRFGRILGLNSFFAEVCQQVVLVMAGACPHLSDNRELLDKVVRNEELRFGETLGNGLAMLDAEIRRLHGEHGDRACIDGEFIFRLYDTYGFPMDIVRDVALESGISFDEPGFHRAMEKQRQQSRKSWKGSAVEHLDKGVLALLEKESRTSFTGYENKKAVSVVESIIDEKGESCKRAVVGKQYRVFCQQTPFYAEAGGQVGDTGYINWADGSFKVERTFSPVQGIILHEGKVVNGELVVSQEVGIIVAGNLRAQISSNHTATHLLHAAMKEVLGDHVKQAGSLVNSKRLRFDFTHFSPLSREEKEAIEQLVNEKIRDDTAVQTGVFSKEEALAKGAVALFGEKYDDRVRVVSVGEFSKELCGGTHVGSTGRIGFFKLVSESGIAAGVRRVEAVTGAAAVSFVQRLVVGADEVASLLCGSFADSPSKIRSLQKRLKELEKELAANAASRASSNLDELFSSAREINGIRIICGKIPLDSPKTLREVGDKVRDRMTSGVAVLGGEINGKAALLALVSKDLITEIKAGQLVAEVAKIVGGKGGGRPDMAQAGGSMPDKLDEAMAAVSEIIASITGNSKYSGWVKKL
jgi:alanyl-tRNA synthetase